MHLRVTRTRGRNVAKEALVVGSPWMLCVCFPWIVGDVRRSLERLLFDGARVGNVEGDAM